MRYTYNTYSPISNFVKCFNLILEKSATINLPIFIQLNRTLLIFQICKPYYIPAAHKL